MTIRTSREPSRRDFLISASLAAAASLAPKSLLAEEDVLVASAFKEAATAKITVQKLRRNITVLLGADGNIAALTGKLLVDAEIVTARPNVAAALAGIQRRPRQAIDQHALAFRSHRRQCLAA